MAAISVPNSTFNIIPSPETVENAPQRILFIGQQSPTTGTSTSGELIKNIGADGQEDALFGRASMLAYMIRAARRVNVVTRFDAIPMDDGAGSVVATATIEFDGSPDANGTVELVIASKENFFFKVLVLSTDSATDVATKVADAINANPASLATAVSAVAVVTLTCVNKGPFGNTLVFRKESLPAGLTTITFDGFTGGLQEPDTTGIFTQIEDIRYQTIVYPNSFDLSEIEPFMNDRFNSDNAVLDGVVITGRTGSASTIKSIALTQDSQSFLILGNKLISIAGSYEGSAVLENDVAIASEFAAIRALRLTPGQNISNFLVGGNIFTGTGGTGRAALPYHNTPMENLPTVEEELGWTRDEQADLNDNGVAFVGNNQTINSIIMGDMVTTFLTSAQDVPSTVFKFLNAVDTSSAIREFFFNNNKSQYAQSVLTQGELIAGASFVNTTSFAAFQDTLYTDLSLPPFGLVPKGKEFERFFSENLVVTANFESGTLSFTALVPIVSQVRKINGTLQIQFTLQTGG